MSRFSVSDIIQFYQQFEDNIKRSTVDWRIYELTNADIIHRMARGIYSLKEVRHYQPEITRANKLLYGSFKKQFPYARGCFWDTRWLNEFMLHQPGRFYTLLEVEKDVLEAVFYEMKDQGKEAFLNPSEEVIDKYIVDKRSPLLLLPLISEAPTQEIDGVRTITIEKMLVDLVSNASLFAAQQGSELKRIFKAAYEKYTISEAKILRYASRRNRKEAIELLIKSR